MSVLLDGDQLHLGEVFLEDFPRVADGEGLASAQKALSKVVGAVDPGMVMLDGKEFGQFDELGLRARFIEDLALGRSREQSAHGLYFGQMVLDSVSDHQRPELVAVKLFENDPEGAIHELTLNTYVNSLDGHNRAFSPLGFWRDTQGNLNLLTRYEHSVQSYDNILWAHPDEDPDALEPEKIRKAVRMSMFGVGLLHGLGLRHGDAQAKNLGTDSEKVRFIDLESATLQPRLQTEEGRETAVADIDTFLESCFRNQGIGPDDNGNILEIGEAMLDIVESASASYLRGVCRAQEKSKDQYSDLTTLSQADIQHMMGRIISTALESIEY